MHPTPSLKLGQDKRKIRVDNVSQEASRTLDQSPWPWKVGAPNSKPKFGLP